jgi:predicted MFS family arabinose efflux permease
MPVLTNTTAGNIIQYGGFRVAFHAMGGAFVISLILVIIWMPETAFHRPKMTLNAARLGEVLVHHLALTAHLAFGTDGACQECNRLTKYEFSRG